MTNATPEKNSVRYRSMTYAAIGLLAFGIAMAAIAAIPNAAGERHGYILSQMPKKGTKAFELLQQIASDKNGASLEMSGGQMWSIAPDKMDALIHVAEEQGVTLNPLGEDWNHILKPMRQDRARMAPDQMAVMKKTMASKNVMGIAEMRAPPPAIMEYALMKGMTGEQGKKAAPSELVIPIDDARKIVATRTHLEKLPHAIAWHGRINGTSEFANLMWWPDGRMSGTFSYDGHQYVVKSLGGDMHGVVAMNLDKMPDHGAMDPSKHDDTTMANDPLVRYGDASMMRRGHPETTYKADNESKRGSEKPELATIKVLVGYTKKAAAHFDDIKRDLIALAVAQTNQTFRNSHVANVNVELVHSFEVDYDESKGNHFNHVWRYADKGDRYMEAVHALRDEKQADVALLIVDDATGCGLATRVAADAEEAFAVVHHECAVSSYSFAHEIGHLIGARHDRSLDTNSRPFPYGHGFVNGKEWRTMMSYKSACDGCPRLPIWSSPTVEISGIRAGAELTDNARVISEQAKRVANFR